MRYASFESSGEHGIAVVDGHEAHGLVQADDAYPGSLDSLILAGDCALERAGRTLRHGRKIDLSTMTPSPVVGLAGRVICVGINYLDHVKETGNEVPPHPTIFTRFSSSLVGHRAPLIRPRVSTQFDYEGELVAVIGLGGRHIKQTDALDHVAGYTIFNDATVRDWQFETTQWTIGKNFDGTGAIGPVFVTADELPPGGKGLDIETRVNGEVVQHSNTREMIYDVATCIAYFSEAFALRAGDVLVMGTPPGVGWARKPQLFLKPGDSCEVEIEGVGTLINPVAEEALA